MGAICGYFGDLDENCLHQMRECFTSDSSSYRIHAEKGVGVCSVGLRDSGIAASDGNVLAYTGHIWNSQSLKQLLRLENHLNTADLLLRLFVEKGETFPEFIDGDFAVAVCHPPRKMLLARDRVGLAPIYFTRGESVLFASRIGAILSTNLVKRELDITGLDYYLSFGHIPSHETLFRGIMRLPSASIARLLDAEWFVSRYWEIQPSPDPSMTTDEWATQFQTVLTDVLRRYLGESDRPVGVFLSGIDSSILSSMLRNLTTDHLHAFTICFEDDAYNEPFAERTAEYLDLDFHEVLMTSDDLPDVLSSLVLAYDDLLSEPFGSVPTFVLASAAARHIRTVFTGDGAGLIFSESEPKRRDYRLVPAIPKPIRDKLVTYPFKSVRSGMLRRPLKALDTILTEVGLRCSTAARVYYGQLIFLPHERRSLCQQELYEAVVTSTFAPVMDLIERAKNELQHPEQYYVDLLRFKTRMADTWGFYIPRVHRICTYFSLAPWLPYLDESVLKLAARVPRELNSTESKPALRTMARKFSLLPSDIINQPKRGMQFPFDKWLTMEAGDYCERTIRNGLRKTPRIFRESTVEKVLRRRDPGKLFALVMLFLWLERHFPEGVRL